MRACGGAYSDRRRPSLPRRRRAGARSSPGALLAAHAARAASHLSAASLRLLAASAPPLLLQRPLQPLPRLPPLPPLLLPLLPPLLPLPPPCCCPLRHPLLPDLAIGREQLEGDVVEGLLGALLGVDLGRHIDSAQDSTLWVVPPRPGMIDSWKRAIWLMHAPDLGVTSGWRRTMSEMDSPISPSSLGDFRPAAGEHAIAEGGVMRLQSTKTGGASTKTGLRRAQENQNWRGRPRGEPRPFLSNWGGGE